MSTDPFPDLVMLRTDALILHAVEMNAPQRAYLCWHGIANCPLCSTKATGA